MKNHSGFTLVEILIVIAIFAIIAAIGVPSYMSQLPNIHLKAAARDIKTDMETAKLRAVRENASVAVLFNAMNDAYNVFVDDGAGGGTANNHVRDGTETLVRSVILPAGVDLYVATFAGNQYTVFNGRGLPGNYIGHAYLKNSKGNYRGIVLNMVGRITIQQSSNGSTWTDVN